MWILLSAVLTASVMGSLHCVGMCGPLALWAAGADRNRQLSALLLPTTLYQLGRLISFVVAGIIAGAIGMALDLGGKTMGVQLMAARVVGGAMIAIGILMALRLLRLQIVQSAWWKNRKLLGGPISSVQGKASVQEKGDSDGKPAVFQPPQATGITKWIVKLRPFVFRLPLPLRGLVTGLLTALLPCGWLYLFALLAAGTGSSLTGALVMAAFWLGSVPAMVSLVVSARLLTVRIRSALPALASILLIVAGAYTATGRGMAELSGEIQLSGSLIDELKSGQELNNLDTKQLRKGVSDLASTPLPCCQTLNGTSDEQSAGSIKEAP